MAVLAVGWYIANQPEDEGPDGSQAAADESREPGTAATAAPGPTRTSAARPTPTAAGPAIPARYDLGADEERGGHTIERHVGKTERELLARLEREPDISAASSYFDLETAEVVVAAALKQKRDEVDRWSRGSGGRANLALRYGHDEPVGITVERGARRARDVESVVVVLRWTGDDWYVLTSYPDD